MSRVARGNERRVSFTCRSVMRWLTVCAWVLWAGSAGLAQVFFNVDDLDKAMKAVGRNVALANAAIVSKDFDGAKVRVARALQRVARVHWRVAGHQLAVVWSYLGRFLTRVVGELTLSPEHLSWRRPHL